MAYASFLIFDPFLCPFSDRVTAVSIAALVSCRFVIYEDETEAAELTYRTAGVYCYDSSLKEKVQNFFLGSVAMFVRFAATFTVILGAFAVFLVWKGIKKPHGKYMYKSLGCLVFWCVPGMFCTLSLLQADFCWNYKGFENNCSLGWGGNCAIASGCLYFAACIALCCVPQPNESDDDEDGDDNKKPSATKGDEEAPEVAPAAEK